MFYFHLNNYTFVHVPRKYLEIVDYNFFAADKNKSAIGHNNIPKPVNMFNKSVIVSLLCISFIQKCFQFPQQFNHDIYFPDEFENIEKEAAVLRGK